MEKVVALYTTDCLICKTRQASQASEDSSSIKEPITNSGLFILSRTFYLTCVRTNENAKTKQNKILQENSMFQWFSYAERY